MFVQRPQRRSSSKRHHHIHPISPTAAHRPPHIRQSLPHNQLTMEAPDSSYVSSQDGSPKRSDQLKSSIPGPSYS
uniref:Uncharacterized protein n=1 Tax=Kalanchoe fedtschenkoi TaxID=63787 RepID=A0A7N0RHY9_KALFE